MVRSYQILLFTLALAALTACGSGEPKGEIVDTVAAGGTLTYKNQALENYEVTLHPVSGTRGASGKTDAEGKFLLGANDQGDGAPPGRYKVTVTYSPPQFAGEAGKEEFTATPPPKVQIPEKFGNVETSGIEVEVPESGTSELKIDLK